MLYIVGHSETLVLSSRLIYSVIWVQSLGLINFGTLLQSNIVVHTTTPWYSSHRWFIL